MCQAMASELEGHGYAVRTCGGAAAGLSALETEDFDVVITDLKMRDMNGLELCQRIAINRRDLPVIVVTAFGTLETAIATIRAGAFDFITKPFDIDDIVVAVERAERDRKLRREVERLQSALEAPSSSSIIGSGSATRDLLATIDRIAISDVSVLVTGESGTGKELVAREIHRRGPSADGPFVAVNCGAIPEALMESELFGHAKGAFTDAKVARRGLFPEADGGTLFLDEIGEMPVSMQVKLLRALEERSVRPVGSNASVPFEARLIAATNRSLEAAVQEKTFREDLYYRIHVIHIDVPPLRERGGDILELAQHFLRVSAARQKKSVVGFSAPVAERLLAYAWPGNVRELLNTIERAVAMTQFTELVVDDLPERIRSYQRRPLVVAADPDELVSLDELERRYVTRVMEVVGGNKSSAARVLGLDRTTLYRMLDRYGLR
jgi:two-component system response regulator HydG